MPIYADSIPGDSRDKAGSTRIISHFLISAITHPRYLFSSISSSTCRTIQVISNTKCSALVAFFKSSLTSRQNAPLATIICPWISHDSDVKKQPGPGGKKNKKVARRFQKFFHGEVGEKKLA